MLVEDVAAVATNHDWHIPMTAKVAQLGEVHPEVTLAHTLHRAVVTAPRGSFGHCSLPCRVATSAPSFGNATPHRDRAPRQTRAVAVVATERRHDPLWATLGSAIRHDVGR